MIKKQIHKKIRSYPLLSGPGRGAAGQSLIEIVVGLAIGSVLIGAAVVGVMFVLRTGSLNERSQTGSSLSRSLLERARSVSSAHWTDVYSLSKGEGVPYYVVASGTRFVFVEGREGVLTDIPTAGLVAYWGLDEAMGDSLHDATRNEAKGTLFGTTYAFPCRVGGCRSFDGIDDYALVGDVSALNLSQALTLSLWMRSGAVPDFSDAGLLAKGGLRYGLTYHSDGNVRFYIGDATNYAAAPASAGEWHHVVGVFDGLQGAPFLRLYIDGVLQGTSTSVFSETGASGDLLFGRYNSNYFEGEMDDVRVYNWAFRDADVSLLYQGGAFTRYLTFENVERSPAGEVVSSGGIEDPSTQEARAHVEWVSAGASQASVEVRDYLTRWQNEVFQQTDWSEGAVPLSPQSEPGGGYSNSSNIRFSPGSIQIDEL